MPNLLDETPGLIGFVRAVETGSFSSAAKLLRTSPSAVSRSVSRLEHLVNARLFLRSTRSLALTPEGQALFEKVSPLLRQLDLAEDLEADDKRVSGRIKFSIPSELGRFLMTPIFRDFATSFPAVKLEVGITDRQVDLIREDYDIAFRIGAGRQGELRVRRLADVKTVIVASAAFVEQYGKPNSVDEASRLPFVRYVVDGRPSPVVFSDGTSFIPHGRVDCDTGQALRAAARHGLGAALFMRCAVHDELRAGHLICISDQLALPSLPLNAVHAFGSLMPQRLRRFCDFVAQQSKRIPDL